MIAKKPSNRPKLRGHRAITQFSGLGKIVNEITRLWRRHHLSYDQTKYVVEQARHHLALQPPGVRRRTVERLAKAEVERLIQSTYESHSKYGLMIKTLFMTGTRVAEFVHIQVKDLHLDADPPQIYITHAKRGAKRYVPILPSLAQGTAHSSTGPSPGLFV
jgi:integrase/recombinase XerD